MVMRVDCLVRALDAIDERAPERRFHRVLLTPQGAPFNQVLAAELLGCAPLVLIAGRYEGFDERVRHFVDREVSLGDFVLTGGEIAAMAMIETVARLIPGVLGNQESASFESFSPAHGGMLEFAQYTRPAEFRGLGVPEVLKSGDHGKIAAYRAELARERTRERRPDLMPPGSGQDSIGKGTERR